MAEYIVECLCGHRRHVGENSIGLTGRCPKCGRELVVTDEMLVSENEEPAGVEVAEDAPDRREAKGAVRGFLADDEEEPAEFVEEQPRVSGSGCARCGREFRGDWDRHTTANGVLCNICANMVGAQPVDTTTTPMAALLTPAQMADIAAQSAETSAALAEPEVESNPEPPGLLGMSGDTTRNVVLVAGVMVMLFSVGVYLFGDHMADEPDPMQIVVQAEEEAPPELPRALVYAGLAITLLSGLVAEFCALFFTLRWLKALPNDGLGANLIAVGLVTLLFQTAFAVPGFFIPPLGYLLGAIKFFALPLFVYWFYGLRFWDVVTYLFVRFLVSVAVHIATLLLLGALANVFV